MEGKLLSAWNFFSSDFQSGRDLAGRQAATGGLQWRRSLDRNAPVCVTPSVSAVLMHDFSACSSDMEP